MTALIIAEAALRIALWLIPCVVGGVLVARAMVRRG